RFGRGAGGDCRLLNKFSRIYIFKLKTFKVVTSKARTISSTYIRKLIKEGNLREAERLLGRPVSVLGTVKRGNLLARSLGFPTANIDPHHEVIPPSGVYAVRIVFQKNKFNGVCNIGSRPTFNSSSPDERHIEVYIIGFSKNIYGKDLEIHFLKKIRPERKFASCTDLANQIKKDILSAEKVFLPF
ncbi:MAG: riboflavin kinase, partial [Candidatus Omnitrophota bacterium]|nr:riboflavin kinase [Candidatus Omnitrophota bacterium]